MISMNGILILNNWILMFAFAVLFAHSVLKHSIVMTSIMRDTQNTIFNLYLQHDNLRFNKAFELDESVIDLISQANDLLSESHVGTGLLNTFICPTIIQRSARMPKIWNSSRDSSLLVWQLLALLFASCLTIVSPIIRFLLDYS
jgi:hypothetical protein